jgi:hypothetical protein
MAVKKELQNREIDSDLAVADAKPSRKKAVKGVKTVKPVKKAEKPTAKKVVTKADKPVKAVKAVKAVAKKAEPEKLSTASKERETQKNLDATQLYLNEIGFSPLLTPVERPQTHDRKQFALSG